VAGALLGARARGGGAGAFVADAAGRALSHDGAGQAALTAANCGPIAHFIARLAAPGAPVAPGAAAAAVTTAPAALGARPTGPAARAEVDGTTTEEERAGEPTRARGEAAPLECQHARPPRHEVRAVSSLNTR